MYAVTALGVGAGLVTRADAAARVGPPYASGFLGGPSSPPGPGRAVEAGEPAEPSSGVALALGTDRLGRSILFRAVYAVKVAVLVGGVVALSSVALGTLLGACAGLFGGWVDRAVGALHATLASLPAVLVFLVLAAAFLDGPLEGTLVPVCVALGATSWIGPCRVARSEALRLRELGFVQSATAAGLSRTRVLWRHVLPNLAPQVRVHLGLVFVGAVQAEVVLSFLGLGPRGEPSWGAMIRQATLENEVLSGFYWQFGAATALLFGLVLSLSVALDEP